MLISSKKAECNSNYECFPNQTLKHDDSSYYTNKYLYKPFDELQF